MTSTRGFTLREYRYGGGVVRQDKSRSRVTPKTGQAAEASARSAPAGAGPSGVSRTPVRVRGGRTQALIPYLMFTLMGMGLVVILGNYVITDHFGAPSNWYLLGGLGLILAGIVVATQYR